VDGGGPWTTPSELAEYAFCPRAQHYRITQDAPASESAAAGTRYHQQRLGAERWRDEHRRLPWLAVVTGLLLLAIAATVLLL